MSTVKISLQMELDGEIFKTEQVEMEVNFTSDFSRRFHLQRIEAFLTPFDEVKNAQHRAKRFEKLKELVSSEKRIHHSSPESNPPA